MFNPENPAKIIPQTNQEQEKKEDFKSIYRGIWADRLSSGQELPVGGSLFNENLSTKLKLDFDYFEDDLENFTEENIRKVYEQNKESIISWLKQVGSDFDPYTYFILYQVQQKMEKLLAAEQNSEVGQAERLKMYQSGNAPRLSELKGKTQCAERAAMGQYMLQKAGLKSSYVSGITMADAKDEDDFPDDHSFIVLDDSSRESLTFIFDIARPKSQHNLPRILKTAVPFEYELLKDKKKLLVAAEDILQGGKLYFGTGDTTSGHKEIIE
jgi:hypothetical protein